MFFKKKVVKILSGEKINLLSRLTLSGKIDDIEEKYVNIIEYCNKCNRNIKKVQVSYNLGLNEFMDESKTPTIMEDSDFFEKKSILKSLNFKSSQKKLKQNFSKKKIISTIEETNEKETKLENNENISNFENSEEFENCTCKKSYQNYKKTKLRLTYLAYVKFIDGTNSLLKTETVWNIKKEPSVIINLHIKNEMINLENSIDLNIIIENNLNEDLDLKADENSFKFIYSKNDKNFGAMILENKLVRSIYVERLAKDTVVFSFMPVKSGFIELEEIRFYDESRKKDWVFKCDYRILIN